MKIAIVSEQVFGVPDEGMKNFALKLFEALEQQHDMTGIAVFNKSEVGESKKFICICSNRLFINRKLYAILRQARPDLIIYSSASCGNFFALLRMKILKLYVPDAKIAVIVFQPARYNRFLKPFLPFLMPDLILSQTPESKDSFSFAKDKVFFLPSGVDTSKFVPVDLKTKEMLRIHYGFSKDDYIILHVGHVNGNRGVGMLAEIFKTMDCKVLLVGSTSTVADENLVRELNVAGVQVMNRYFHRIEEIYQMADLYIFPVQNEDASIGVPLSVLEAMACNIPVLSTLFGGLPVMFKEGDGFYFFKGEQEPINKLNFLTRNTAACNNRQMVLPYDWQRIGEMIAGISLGKGQYGKQQSE